MSDRRLALIGLDTSHTVAFAQRMQQVDGIVPVSCLRFPSPFQTEPQQDERQAALEALGVQVTRELDQAVDGVDGILLEINDPAQHLPWFERVAGLGLPVFIDKPLAADLASARRIAELAAAHGVAAWEASPLRFSTELGAAVADAGAPEVANVSGALGQAAAGSSLVWYGCHTVQMLHQIMGGGAASVRSIASPRGVVSVIGWADGRQGVVESITGCYAYGGRVHGPEGVHPFAVDGKPLYDRVVAALRDFFVDGTIPVPLAHGLEAQLWLEAAELSLQRDAAVDLAELTEGVGA